MARIATCPACQHVRNGIAEMCSVEWCRCVCTDHEPPVCELCGEPAGEGNALCPACQENER